MHTADRLWSGPTVLGLQNDARLRQDMLQCQTEIGGDFVQRPECSYELRQMPDQWCLRRETNPVHSMHVKHHLHKLRFTDAHQWPQYDRIYLCP